MSLRIHQIGSVLAAGDAVTNHIVEIDRRLKAWGFTSHIYGADIAATPIDTAQPDAAYLRFIDEAEDVLLYHYSAYCENHALFRRSRNRKVLIYHNITPGRVLPALRPLLRIVVQSRPAVAARASLMRSCGGRSRSIIVWSLCNKASPLTGQVCCLSSWVSRIST